MPRLIVALAATALATLGVTAAASAHDPRQDRPARAQTAPGGTSLPGITSPNVRFIETHPGTLGISGEFAHSAPFFYVSGLDSISVFDVSDPRHPKLRGKLANLVFENEAMSYGERKVGGVLRRWVLVGNDLYNATADTSGVQRGRIGGGEVIVVDVTDPAQPRVHRRIPAQTSTHTVQCLTVSCEFAYTAGDEGQFSIIDLRDFNAPKEAKVAFSPAAGRNEIFTSGAGHYWDNADPSGLAWHTGSGGAAAFKVSDPLNPTVVATTNAQGTATPWNDFIHHNSMRPNGKSFVAGTAPNVKSGNVLLVTEEDYFNDGDEVICDRAGSFQTWHVASYAPGGVVPLDLINPVTTGDGLSAPVGGFCSAHWFDYHQSGIIAQGYYQQGLRFIDVRDARDLKQYGFFTSGASEVWDAYWVPERNKNGIRTDRKSNVVYATDLVRGLDVLEVDLPK